MIGHGIDVVNVDRFKLMDVNRLNRLAYRICTKNEYNVYVSQNQSYHFVAKVWACKEAVSKAFGTGIRNNVTWKNIEITKNSLGAPVIKFYDELIDNKCFLSLSYVDNYILASAIIGVQSAL